MFRGNAPRSAAEWVQDAKDLSNEHPSAAQVAALIGIGTFLMEIRDLLKFALGAPIDPR